MSGSNNNDPFAFQGDPNAPGALGQSVGFWQDLARYGGNVAAAANARTASGHLANGTGALGAFGAAINPTLDAARQNAVTRSNLGLQQQQTRKAGMENQLMSYQLPIAQANAELNAKLMDPVFARNYMQSLYGDQNAPPTGGVAPQGGPGPSGLINSESGGNPGAVNKATGASGLAQFTPGRLADLGMYQPPAQGGQWTGQFNIPGFPGVKTYQDFLSNPQAQQAAYTAHMADVQKNIAATPGADKFDPNGLAAVAHLGGVHGMQKFVATNGGYNPSDANGTSLMAYYQKFSGHGAASPASGPRTASAPMAGGGAPQSAALPAPVQVAGPGAPTDATIAPPASSTAQGPTLGSAPADGTVAPGMPPSGMPAPGPQAQGPGPMVPGGRGEQPQGAFTAPSQQPATVQPDQAMMAQALDYERRAGILEQQQNFARDRQKMGVMVPMPGGDPAIMRAAAAKFREAALAGPITAAQEGAKLPFVKPTEQAKADVAVATAGPIQAAKSRATAQNTLHTDRFGNQYRMDENGQFQFLGRGSEVKQVYNSTTGNYDWGEVGGLGIGAPGNLPSGSAAGPRAGTQPAGGGSAGNASPAGAVPGETGSQVAAPGPGNLEDLKNRANVKVGDIDHDRAILEKDLSHVIDSGMQNKANLLHLRDLIPQSSTGFAGETRAGIQNFLQTVLPKSVSDTFDVNASPAQELMKITTMGAGKADQEDHGAAKALGLMQLYMKAYPNMENQPDANQHMTNLLLVAQQAHMDYTLGANQHYMKSRDEYGRTGNYTPLNHYDDAYASKMPAETYFSAADALNGQPYEKWSKGLTGPQLQVVGGILQRADPNAQVNVAGKMVPVSAFTKTVSPTDLVSPNGR